MRRLLNLTGFFAVFWLITRVALGWAWLDAGLDKLGDRVWTGADAGVAATGFLSGAIERAAEQTAHPEVQGWYATLAEDVFIPNADIFSYLVVAGQIAIGIALFAGLLTKPAAFFGLIMSFAFLLAGTTSTNPYLIVMAIALLVAAQPGVIGLDRYALPWLRRQALRLRSEAQWRRWTVPVGATVGTLFLGFVTYVALDDAVTFAAVWAATIGFGTVWLLALPRLSAWRPPAGGLHHGRIGPMHIEMPHLRLR